MLLSMRENSDHLAPVQERALQLFNKGFGYKSIARQLGLDRDDVRNWIRANRSDKTGLMSLQNTPLARLRESVMSKYNGAGEVARERRSRRIDTYIEDLEASFEKPRKAYEDGTDSLMKVSEKFGVSYKEFRDFLRIYHPESRLLHAYAVSREQLLKEINHEVARIQQKGEAILNQMTEELSTQLDKLNK